jgi:nucleoside-diphosphate-sugar epimerase
MVVHCGATVNWLLNYEAIRGPNVLGTAELIDLASDQFLKPFVFVSTASTGYTEEGEMLPPSQILRSNPYAISKWVAEKLVRRAGKAGLPISIFKPGMITGSSTTGASNPSSLSSLFVRDHWGVLTSLAIKFAADYVSRYIRGLLRTRTFFHSSLNVELIPVDFVAKVIVALGLATQSNQMTYHIANNNTITYSQLASLISARVPLTGSLLFPKKKLTTLLTGLATFAAQPYINFRQAVVSDQANPLWALLPFFGPTQFNMNMLPATDTETRKALPVGFVLSTLLLCCICYCVWECGSPFLFSLICPQPSEELISKYVEYLSTTE